MPKFLDYHASMPQLPPEAQQMIAGRIQASKPDEFGVRPVNVFIGTNGSAHCLTEAPSADAVVQSHKALGFDMPHSDVQEVMSMG